jgi:hypothetical protein
MWKLKNSDEYAVFANSKKQAKDRFKKNLGMTVSIKNLVKVD